SSPSWQSTPTAAPSRWQRSAGRVAREFRPFSVPRILPLVSSSKSREARRRCRARFNRAMGSVPSFRNLMYGYVHAYLEQVMVSGACNGAHSLTQRLARWLLMMRDRSDGDELPITQNILAEMLGVQRPTITNAARELERAGLIERGRRQLTILDRRA